MAGGRATRNTFLNFFASSRNTKRDQISHQKCIIRSMQMRRYVDQRNGGNH
ncbi:hypothetical protein Hdeb2414_s0007g00260901 [Helianthus debilis subsp. tardiflorus]